MTTPNNMIYRTWRYSFWQLTLPVSSRDPISSQPFQNLKPYTKLGCLDFGHQIGEICRYFHPFPELLMAAQSDKCRASQQLLDGYTARHLCDSLRVTRQLPVIHERYVERWQTIGEWRANYRSSTRDVSNAGSPSASDAPTTGHPREMCRTVAVHRRVAGRICADKASNVWAKVLIMCTTSALECCFETFALPSATFLATASEELPQASVASGRVVQ